MKVGDLVSFYTPSWAMESFNQRYSNPGIVIGCTDPISGRVIAVIYWRDGRITREHESYLTLMEDSYESR